MFLLTFRFPYYLGIGVEVGLQVFLNRQADGQDVRCVGINL